MKLSVCFAIKHTLVGMVFLFIADTASAADEFASRLEILGQSKLTNSFLSDTVPIQIQNGKYQGDFQSVDLQIDGHIYRGDDAALFAPLAKHAHFMLDTCYLKNGQHTLQIQATWLNPNPTNPNSIYDFHQSTPISISVSNEIFYPEWESEIGETGFAAYFFKTIHTNAIWHLDIYDVKSNFVQRLSGHATSGKIEALWNMKDVHGVMRTNNEIDPEFSSVISVEDAKQKWKKVVK
jgi:hypothetical protein